MRAHFGGDIVDAESGGGRVSDHARHECAQLTTVMVGRLCLLRRGGDEGADAAARFDDAGPFELGVDTGDGVGVDAEVDGELTDGGQLIAGLESAGRNRRAQAAIELRINRRAIVRVD
jgi:hypothetical protein